MNILYTTHQFLPDYAAGTETLAFSTATAMARRGHRVGVVTGHPARSAVEADKAFDRYDFEGIPVDRYHHFNAAPVNAANPMRAEYDNPFVSDFFRRRVAELKPDLVHFYHLQRLSASVIDVCREAGIPTVMTATDFWLVCPTNQLLLPDHSSCSGPDASMVNCVRHLAVLSKGRGMRSVLDRLPDGLLAVLIRGIAGGWGIERRYAPLVRALAARPAYMKTRMNRIGLVLVATRFMAEVLQRNGLQADRIRHVPFGVDTSGISRISEKGAREHLRVGFIGTLYHHKGAHVLIEAVRSLPADLPLEISIYGDPRPFPEYAGSLRTAAGGDLRIAFRGTFPNDAIGEIFYDMDVLVVPSLWYENAPLVLSFAQAAKVPVVATDLQGISEVIAHGENGLLFEKGDVKALAGILAMLCRDRSALRGLSERARPPKTIAAYADELEGIYGEVIRGAAPV